MMEAFGMMVAIISGGAVGLIIAASLFVTAMSIADACR